ncbi:hypothetical protein [uncultured Dokdonia sp.]|uniref:hypothetical protein n=1 Tax=uncultured Dokdonia sp. TaxID=575653 RepID=UPI002624876E|nr:hypothetical protein [uncultured Dokdonia sp.]
MKNTSFVIILMSCLIIMAFLCMPSHHILKSGSISFKSMNAQKDEFTIQTTSVIFPNTYIYFTDTEWNGTHFGIDEHTLLWNSGEDSIPLGSIIYFKSFASHTISSIGST